MKREMFFNGGLQEKKKSNTAHGVICAVCLSASLKRKPAVRQSDQ